MAKTRIKKMVTPAEALAGAQRKGHGLNFSMWNLHKLCRLNLVKHERTGYGTRARIMMLESDLIAFLETLNH